MPKKTKKKEAPMMVRVSTLKEFIKGEADVNVSGDFPEAVNEELANVVRGAISRCGANNRKTLRPADL